MERAALAIVDLLYLRRACEVAKLGAMSSPSLAKAAIEARAVGIKVFRKTRTPGQPVYR
jgi:hypothetical protein